MQINVPVLDKLEQNNIPVLQWNIMDKDSKQMLPANEKKSKNWSGHKLKSNQL